MGCCQSSLKQDAPIETMELSAVVDDPCETLEVAAQRDH